MDLCKTKKIKRNLKTAFFWAAYFVFDRLLKLLLHSRGSILVMQGPFQGMAYPPRSVGSVLAPKLLGTYEIELAPIIKNLPAISTAIDIGAAEGWYSVGLLFAQKVQRMIAFEKSREGRDLMQSLAKKNGCAESLEILGECKREDLYEVLHNTGQTNLPILIISDCEGFEDQLFTPQDLKDLSRAWLLLETHDFIQPGVHARIKKMLNQTHETQELWPERRTTKNLPANFFLKGLADFFPPLAKIAMAERRPPCNGWIYAKPRLKC